MKKLILSLLLAMPSILFAQTPPIEPGVSHELAKWRAAHYSDVRYKLNLTLEKMSPVLKGTIEIRVKVKAQAEPPALAGGETSIQAEQRPVVSMPRIVLDWRKIRGHEEKSTISSVSVNGKPVTLTSSPPAHAGGSAFEEHNDHLIFREGVVVGENVIKLDFTSPILPSGSAITRYVDKEDGSEYIYSLFVPSDASTAFPVFDQPDLKARFELDINAPSEWTVVSNSEKRKYGPWVDPAEAAKYPKHLSPSGFPPTRPLSTYVFAFAAGPWEKVAEPPALAGGRDSGTEKPVRTRGRDSAVDDRSVEAGTTPPAYAGGSAVYVRRSQAAKFKPHAAEVFRLNREAVKYFEQYFDYKFPFPKYDLVLIPEFPFGGMEHAGATFLRESAIIFPQEPTKNDLVSRATLIFHEAAHQWFGDTVTMRWFDDLWLKEGFATFTAYKAMEKIMPEMNAWKVFYERIKQGAYQTDSTRGTTAIYQPIANLSAAKSAYGNIVYNKAPAFLRQAEFYLGEDKFQTAVRAFLRKHEFGNAGWEDLVKEFQISSGGHSNTMKLWAEQWVMQRGLPIIRADHSYTTSDNKIYSYALSQKAIPEMNIGEMSRWWRLFFNLYAKFPDGKTQIKRQFLDFEGEEPWRKDMPNQQLPDFVFPNYGDYGYGIFLLDEKSRDHVLKNIQNEKDPFLRSMMWGALWDSVREGELDPRVFVELVVKVLQRPDREGGLNTQRRDQALANAQASAPEEDESTVATLLGRTGTALNYYIDKVQRPDRPAPRGQPEADGGREGGLNAQRPDHAHANAQASAAGGDLRQRVEDLLIERMQNAPPLGQRITYYRSFLNVAASEKARKALKGLLAGISTTPAAKPATPPIQEGSLKNLPLRTKDKFDIVTRLLILNDPEAPGLLADLEKTETSDDAKRYAYAARAGIGTAENKAKYWNDFTANKEISESWIEAAFGPWNSVRHADLTLPYLQKALQELPNHKRNRKIFFVNGWLGAFIGGQRSEEALNIVNKFLADNPNLDNDLRLKILENVDMIERAVRIRGKY